MPPKKTFVFEHIQYPGIKISIEAYAIELAQQTLKFMVKHPKEFKNV